MRSPSNGPSCFAAACDALLDAWALVVPVSCAGCGAPDRGLCAGCRARLLPAEWPGDETRLVHWSGPGGIPGLAARPYDAFVGAILLAYKQEARTSLVEPLAAALEPAFRRAVREAARATGGVPLEIATIPARRRAARERGFHPVEQLVRRCRSHPSRPLRWVREPADQRDFGRSERLGNLAGALAARRPLDGRSFLLVEDVVTTGATVGEAVRAVRAAGGAVVGVVAVARVGS